MRWFAIALLLVSAAPAAAAETCERWIAEMIEDEGGEVLTAEACAIGQPEAYLVLQCWGDGQFGVRFDLAAGAEREADLEETAPVVFSSEAGSQTLALTYEAMDGMFATGVGADDPLFGLLKSGNTLTVRDARGIYPDKQLSLAGSAAALGKLVAGCP